MPRRNGCPPGSVALQPAEGGARDEEEIQSSISGALHFRRLVALAGAVALIASACGGTTSTRLRRAYQRRARLARQRARLLG